MDLRSPSPRRSLRRVEGAPPHRRAGRMTAAVLDVRLEVGTDGRVMAGQLRESFPASTGLRRCAVGPLLGARIEGELPDERMQVRYVYRLGAVGDVRSAQR